LVNRYDIPLEKKLGENHYRGSRNLVFEQEQCPRQKSRILVIVILHIQGSPKSKLIPTY